MRELFYLTFVIWQIFALPDFIKNKRIGLNCLCLLGVYLPLFLYFANWSTLCDVHIDDRFYLIFFYLNIGLTIHCLLGNDAVTHNYLPYLRTLQPRYIGALNVVVIVLYFLETYLLTGHFFSALNGIDVHTSSVPVISVLTRNLFVVYVADVISYLCTRKNKYLVYAAVGIVVPLISRSARMTLFGGVAKIAVLIAIAFLNNRENRVRGKNFLNVKLRSILVAGVAALMLVTLVSQSSDWTNTRGSHYGKYDWDYATKIGYSGPEILGNTLPVYYGYFPLSFSNLNMSLKAVEPSINYFGLHSFSCLWFGLLNLDNVFGLNPFAADDASIYLSGAANVQTAFWIYWYDYGYLCFIPIFAMIGICDLMARICNKRGSLVSLFIYLSVVPSVVLQSFQNIFFSNSMIWGLLLSAIVAKVFFIKDGCSGTVRPFRLTSSNASEM